MRISIDKVVGSVVQGSGDGSGGELSSPRDAAPEEGALVEERIDEIERELRIRAARRARRCAD